MLTERACLYSLSVCCLQIICKNNLAVSYALPDARSVPIDGAMADLGSHVSFYHRLHVARGTAPSRNGRLSAGPTLFSAWPISYCAVAVRGLLVSPRP